MSIVAVVVAAIVIVLVDLAVIVMRTMVGWLFLGHGGVVGWLLVLIVDGSH